MDVTHTTTLENAKAPSILFGQIQQLTEAGKTDTEIANELLIGLGQIRRIATKNGLKLKRGDNGGQQALLPPMPAAPAAAAPTSAAPTPAPVEKPPRRQRQPRQPRQTEATRATNFEAASGLPGELLMLVGEITVLAARNGLSAQEFVEQCRQYVAVWDKLGPAVLKQP